MSAEIPCGKCDVGMYSYEAISTPLAFSYAEQPPEARTPPRCKSVDRPCVGACDFIDALNSNRQQWEALIAEMDQP